MLSANSGLLDFSVKLPYTALTTTQLSVKYLLSLGEAVMGLRQTFSQLLLGVLNLSPPEVKALTRSLIPFLGQDQKSLRAMQIGGASWRLAAERESLHSRNFECTQQSAHFLTQALVCFSCKHSSGSNALQVPACVLGRESQYVKCW